MLSISWEVLSDVLTEKAPKSSSRDGAGNSSVLRGLLKDYSVVIGKKLRGPLVSGCLRLGMWVSVLKTWYFLSTVYALFTLNVHVYYFYLTNYFTSLQSCTKQSSDSFQQNPPALFTASQTRAKYINYIFHDCRKMHNMFLKKNKNHLDNGMLLLHDMWKGMYTIVKTFWLLCSALPPFCFISGLCRREDDTRNMQQQYSLLLWKWT